MQREPAILQVLPVVATGKQVCRDFLVPSAGAPHIVSDQTDVEAASGSILLHQVFFGRSLCVAFPRSDPALLKSQDKMRAKAMQRELTLNLMLVDKASGRGRRQKLGEASMGSSAMRRWVIGAGFSSTLALAVSSGAAFAQSVDPADAAEENPPAAGEGARSFDNEIVVSARRRDERLIDAPVAISAVSGETLDTYSVNEVTDLAQLVPSMVTSKAASGSSASIFLRGVGSTALSAGFDQSVSFVIDGLPMSRGREISLPQFDIQRVEVLKGPQALFFGKNTTGGLISIVSNGPSDYFEAGGKAGYGFEADEYYAEAFISGPISDTLGARLAGRYSNKDGAFKNSASETYPSPLNFSLGTLGTPDQINRTRNSDRRGFGESYGLRGTIDWEATPGLSFELKAGLSSVEDGGPTDILERLCGGGRTTPQPSVPAPGFVVPASPNTDCAINGVADSAAIPTVVANADYRYARNGEIYADFASQFGVLTTSIDGGVFDVTSITSYYHFKQTDANNVSGESYPANFTQLADFDQFAQELRFQSNFDGGFNALFGAFYSDSNFVFNTDAYILPFPAPPGETYVTFKRDNGFDAKSFSMFGEAQIEVGAFEISAGARYSFEQRNSYQRTIAGNPTLQVEIAQGVFYPTFPGGIEINDKFTDSNLSPQVSIRYKPSRDLTFYAAYKQGFKTGGFNLSQSLALPALFDPGAFEEQGRYTSESAKGGEVGVRALLFGGGLALNATIFRYDYSDLQVQVFDPTAVALIADNAGKLRTQGIEADMNWRVSDILTLRAAAAYNDVKYRDFIGACFEGQTIAQGCAFNLNSSTGRFTSQDYAGRRPPKAPEFSGRAGFTLDVPVGSGRVAFNGDASYTSEYNFTDTLRPDAIQDDFVKLDASLVYHGPDDRWSIGVIGRNLTNELVVGAANDIPFTGGLDQMTGTTGPGVVADMSAFVDNPREIYVEVGFKF